MMTILATLGFLLFVAVIVAGLAWLDPYLNAARAERMAEREQVRARINRAEWPQW